MIYKYFISVSIAVNTSKSTYSYYEGFLVEARQQGNTTRVGTFSLVEGELSKILQCSGATNAVTHPESKHQNTTTFSWTAPETDMGTVEFV